MLKFFAEKMWVAFAMQKLLTFFQQKISAYCISGISGFKRTRVKVLITATAEDGLVFLLFFFRENKAWHFMWILCFASEWFSADFVQHFKCEDIFSHVMAYVSTYLHLVHVSTQKATLFVTHFQTYQQVLKWTCLKSQASMVQGSCKKFCH